MLSMHENDASNLTPDVAAELKRLRKQREMGLKDLVNDLVRRGIRDVNAPARKKAPFRTKSVDLRRVP